MKKFLYGTTALVAAGMLASPASAAEKISLKLGGYMEQWLGVSSQESSYETAIGANYSAFDQQSDSEIYFTGATKLDNGITVSVIVQLEADEAQTNIDESYVKLTSDTIGDLRIGGRKNASWAFGFFAPDVGIGLDSGDVDNWILKPSSVSFVSPDTTRLQSVADRNGVNYFSPVFGGFRVAGSFHPNISNNSQSGMPDTTAHQAQHTLGAVFERDFNGVGIKANFFWGQQYYGESATDENEWRAGALLSYGGFTLGGAYRNISADTTNTNPLTSLDGFIWNVGVKYGSGPFAVSAAYQTAEAEGSTLDPDKDTVDQVIVSGSYNLGPGVDLKGSVFWAEYDDETTAASANNEGVGGVVGIKVGF